MKLNKKSIIVCALAILVFVVFCVIPPFDEELLTADSMRVLGILCASIILWAGNVVHECAVALMMSALIAGIGHVSVGTTFSAFAGSTQWVLIAAFILGAAMKECGLLHRIALMLLKVFPKSYNGTIVGLMTVSTVVSPFVPSKNAKGAILGPVVRSISEAMGYQPKSKQANGLFIAFWTTIMAIPFMFVSGSVSTIALRGFLPEDLQEKFNLVSWALYSLPMMIPLLILLAIFFMKFYGPRKGENVGNELSKEFLNGQLAELGPWSREEKIVSISAVLMILYWIFKAHLGNIPDYASCLLVVAVLMFTNCLDAKTFRTGVSWENVIFIGCCISLGTILPEVGITDWVVSIVGPYTQMAFSNPFLTVIVLIIMSFLVRFLLLSEGSFIAVICALLFPLAMDAGINPWVAGMIINVMVGQFFLPYQSSAFLSGYYGFGADAVDTGETTKFYLVYTVIVTIALLIACVVWQTMGIWWI